MTILLAILILLILNGAFAMAEIALVSVKKARLQQAADEGNSRARVALRLIENPERILSTVQIGITLVGVISAAFGAQNIADMISPSLMKWPLIAGAAGQIAFVIAIIALTYCNIVIGELVPKGLALRNPEGIALRMARPMTWLAGIAKPLVWVLEKSTRLLMKIMGASEASSAGPSREEVRVLVREGMMTGGVDRQESQMVTGVFDLHNIQAEEIMLPRPKMTFLPVDATHDHICQRIATSKQSVFPVYEGSRDQICGLVSLRALYASRVNAAEVMPLRTIMQPPCFVVENQPALQLFLTLKNTPLGAALVTDEFGTIRGFVTIDDIVEEVVGDYKKGMDQEKPCLREMKENCWIVDGMTEIDDVIHAIPELESAVAMEKEAFQTLAGFIIHKIDRLPNEGEVFSIGNLEFHIADMDLQRIDKIIITRHPPQADPSIDAGSVEEWR
jgi:putative hemolysin